MRKLFIISTAVFWLTVAGFWLAGFLHPETTNAEIASVISPQLQTYNLVQVGKHNKEKDCWMAIDGQVYDITSYLPAHPSDPAIMLPWCGKEASQAWQTKTIGRPHSNRAAHLLSKFHIGKLQ